MTEVQGYKVGDTIIVDNSVEFEILWFEQNLFKAPKTKHRAYLKQTNPIAKSNGLSYDKSFSIDELLVRAKIKE